MSDTPETDAVEYLISIGRKNDQWVVRSDVSRKLERERDEARDQAQQMSESNQVLMADIRFYLNAWEQLKEAAK